MSDGGDSRIWSRAARPSSASEIAQPSPESACRSEDRVAAYRRYFEAHRPLLAAYWDNYVVDPDGAHFEEVVRATVTAERDDLRAMLARTDVLALARMHVPSGSGSGWA